MNTFPAKVCAAIALVAMSISAFASTYQGSCTDAPKSQWMAKQDVKAKFEQQGYTVKRVKAGENCYEVYAVNKNNDKTELFVNPVNGALVQEANK